MNTELEIAAQHYQAAYVVLMAQMDDATRRGHVTSYSQLPGWFAYAQSEIALHQAACKQKEEAI